jgi:hypothetical protein
VAWGQWNFADKWSVRFGRQAMALSREDWMGAQDTLGVDYSPNDFTFGIGSSIGGQLHYQGERQRFWAHLSNGAFGTGDTVGSSEFNDMLIGGRYEYQIIGTDWSNWGDLNGRRGRPLGVLLGLAGGYQLNEKNNDLPRNSFQAIADLSVAGDGFQAMVSGTIQPLETRDDGWEYTWGMQVGGGYFFAEKWQVYGRYDLIGPGDRAGDLDSFNAVAVGVNFFPFVRTNRWKFTVEGQYLADAINNTIVAPSGGLGWLASDESGQWGLRFQAQLGF